MEVPLELPEVQRIGLSEAVRMSKKRVVWVRGIVDSLKRYWLSYAIFATALVVNLTHFGYDFWLYGSGTGVLDHLNNSLIEHILLLGTLPISFTVSYLVYRQTDLERQCFLSLKEIERAHRELQELDRLKDEFLSNISHELKTPITICQGAVALMKEGEKERDRLLEIAMDALQDLNHLVEQLLEITWIEKAPSEIRLRELDLPPILSSTLSDVAPLADREGILLEERIEEEIPRVRGSENALRRILYNLLSNGIKFNREGGKVTVGASVVDGAVEVFVEDTGIGMSPEQLERIFERFYQVDSSPTRPFRGMGLGLAIVKKLVELQGGTIRAESEVGKGSRFTITLPASSVDSA
jgi:signal transduction histidine kinase